MRAGMVELSGLTRQEALVIKACATDIKSFKSVVATLIENYSRRHLREGRALGGGTPNNGGWTLGADARVPPRDLLARVLEGFSRRAYPAIDEEEEEYEEEDQRLETFRRIL